MCSCFRIDQSGSQVHLEACPWHDPSTCIACSIVTAWPQAADPERNGRGFPQLGERGVDTPPSLHSSIGRCDDASCRVCKALASV